MPRFIPSDYSEDFTKTTPGDNRNLDLRREFTGRADRAPIWVTSILNGAFMDMLGAEMPIIQPRIHRVLYWISAERPLDFTTKDNVAAYTAVAALDDATPRILRIAGDTLSARGLAGVMSEVKGEPYRTLHVGNLGVLSLMIGVARRLAPQPGDPFPAWQGMQYMPRHAQRQGQAHAGGQRPPPGSDLDHCARADGREQITWQRPDKGRPDDRFGMWMASILSSEHVNLSLRTRP